MRKIGYLLVAGAAALVAATTAGGVTTGDSVRGSGTTVSGRRGGSPCNDYTQRRCD